MCMWCDWRGQRVTEHTCSRLKTLVPFDAGWRFGRRVQPAKQEDRYVTPLEPHTGLMEEVKQLQWLMHGASGFSPTRSVLNRDRGGGKKNLSVLLHWKSQRDLWKTATESKKPSWPFSGKTTGLRCTFNISMETAPSLHLLGSRGGGGGGGQADRKPVKSWTLYFHTVPIWTDKSYSHNDVKAAISLDKYFSSYWS